MPQKYELRKIDIISSTAESLEKAAATLRQVAEDMKQHGLDEAYFPWSQHQWDCLEIVTILTSQCQAVLPTQINAKAQNRPSMYEVVKKKSLRDVASRKLRNADVPPKPRGRPRKTVVR